MRLSATRGMMQDFCITLYRLGLPLNPYTTEDYVALKI